MSLRLGKVPGLNHPIILEYSFTCAHGWTKSSGWHVQRLCDGRGSASTRGRLQSSGFRLQTSDFRHQAPTTAVSSQPSTRRTSFCPTIFLSFAFTRERSARFQEQLGQRFYNGLNSQPTTILRPCVSASDSRYPVLDSWPFVRFVAGTFDHSPSHRAANSKKAFRDQPKRNEQCLSRFCVAIDYGMSYSSNNQTPVSFSFNPLATQHASRSATSTGLVL